MSETNEGKHLWGDHGSFRPLRCDYCNASSISAAAKLPCPGAPASPPASAREGSETRPVYHFCAKCGERLPTRWNEPVHSTCPPATPPTARGEAENEAWGDMTLDAARELIVSVAALTACHKEGCEAHERGVFWCDCGFSDAVYSLGLRLAALSRPPQGEPVADDDLCEDCQQKRATVHVEAASVNELCESCYIVRLERQCSMPEAVARRLIGRFITALGACRLAPDGVCQAHFLESPCTVAEARDLYTTPPAAPAPSGDAVKVRPLAVVDGTAEEPEHEAGDRAVSMYLGAIADDAEDEHERTLIAYAARRLRSLDAERQRGFAAAIAEALATRTPTPPSAGTGRVTEEMIVEAHARADREIGGPAAHPTELTPWDRAFARHVAALGSGTGREVSEGEAIAAYWAHAAENADQPHPNDTLAPPPTPADVREWKRILTAARSADR